MREVAPNRRGAVCSSQPALGSGPSQRVGCRQAFPRSVFPFINVTEAVSKSPVPGAEGLKTVPHGSIASDESLCQIEALKPGHCFLISQPCAIATRMFPHFPKTGATP